MSDLPEEVWEGDEVFLVTFDGSRPQCTCFAWEYFNGCRHIDILRPEFKERPQRDMAERGIARSLTAYSPSSGIEQNMIVIFSNGRFGCACLEWTDKGRWQPFTEWCYHTAQYLRLYGQPPNDGPSKAWDACVQAWKEA